MQVPWRTVVLYLQRSSELQLNRLFKVTKLWSPDGGNEASTTRRSNANPDSLSTMDKNAISMTMENSQLKKLLAEVSLCPNVKISRK